MRCSRAAARSASKPPAPGGRAREGEQRALQRHRGEQGERERQQRRRLLHPPPPLSPARRMPYRFRPRSCDSGGARGSGEIDNGLSGGRGRRDRQCRAGDAEHPRRAPIPGRRDRRGRLRRARPATIIDFGDSGQELKVRNIEHFDFAGWDIALFAAGSAVVEGLCADGRRGRLHGDRQQLAISGWTRTCR